MDPDQTAPVLSGSTPFAFETSNILVGEKTYIL